MLVGTGDPSAFQKDAPQIERLASEPVVWPGCVFVQALTEIDAASMCEMLPPALHPTLPPVAGISLFDVRDSEWGAFRLAQLRIECRSGLRPRGLLVSAVTDNERAAAGLAGRFGFRTRPGTIDLDRGYDASRLSVECEGRRLLSLTLRAPEPIGVSDTQFVSSLHPAETPRGFRLVQVDTVHGVQRAERARVEFEHFDGEGWGEGRIRPSLPLPGVIGIAEITLSPIRFLCLPDRLAFDGTEPVDQADPGREHA